MRRCPCGQCVYDRKMHVLEGRRMMGRTRLDIHIVHDDAGHVIGCSYSARREHRTREAVLRSHIERTEGGES